MKKVLTMLLLTALMFSVTACGMSPEDVTGQIVTNEVATDDTVMNDVEESEVQLSFGVAEGNVYESQFLGLGFNLPTGWNFYTEEQINELNGIAQDKLDDEIATQLENADLIYDMMATDTYGNSISVIIEKMSAISSVAIDVETYAETSANQLPDALKQIGYIDVTAAVGTAVINGEEHVAIEVTATATDRTLYEKIVCMKTGQYITSITAATINTDATDSILANFYSLSQ